MSILIFVFLSFFAEDKLFSYVDDFLAECNKGHLGPVGKQKVGLERIPFESHGDFQKALLENDSIDLQQSFVVKDKTQAHSVYIIALNTLNFIEKEYLMCLTKKDKLRDVIRINPTWVDNNEDYFSADFRFLGEKRFFFKDYDLDRVKEFVIVDRTHNGTMYDTRVNRVFSIKKGKFKIFGEYEDISHFFLDQTFLFRYRLEDKILVYMKEALDAKDSTLVGECKMVFESDTFYFSNVKVFNDYYCGNIIDMNPNRKREK